MESDNRFDMSEITAAMNGHQITDGDGQLMEEQDAVTPAEDPVDLEEDVQVEDTPQPKVVNEEEEQDQTTSDVVEDESTGKKFIPYDRFKEVYKEKKELERKLATKPKIPQTPIIPSIGVDKTSALEVEMLFQSMPEFNPESDKYSEKLDILATKFYKTEPGITKLAAARKAKEFMRSLSSEQETVKEGARNFKATQTDGGLTSRPSTRTVTQIDPDKMSPEQLEVYLRETGQW